MSKNFRATLHAMRPRARRSSCRLRLVGGCSGCSTSIVRAPRASMTQTATVSSVLRQSLSGAWLLSARDVLARASVDADDFAFVDEQGHAHHGASLELGRLLPPGRGIAAQSGIRLHDLKFDV